MKLLKDLIYGIRLFEVVGSTQIAIEGICEDSRKTVKNGLFVAIDGTQVDGHDYIDKAIELGAVAIVCERMPRNKVDGVSYILTPYSSFALSQIAANWYDNPSKEMKVIGVTGTNGKTTVSTLLFNLFSQLEGELCGLMSTIDVRIGREVMPSTHTTPDAIAVQSHMRSMVDAGVKYCCMEVSSHALDQHRVAHVDFDIAIFTNITRDHLDYHGDMNTYIQAKKMLFDMLKPEAVAIYNDDVKHGLTMIQNTRAKKRSYSLQYPSHYKGKILERQFDGMLLSLNDQECWTRIMGDFNAYNILAVYAAAVELGKDPLQVLTTISLLPPVEGRFQTILGKGITAIVDYAHTPDALENVLKTIENINEGQGKIITVVGCGGNRDRGKRPKMAEIAAWYSHTAIFTADNPRDEHPKEIIEDMVEGLSPDLKAKTLEISNRKQAIRAAIKLAEAGDIVLVAGKGHEKYQEFDNGRRLPFDDVNEILLLINS